MNNDLMFSSKSEMWETPKPSLTTQQPLPIYAGCLRNARKCEMRTLFHPGDGRAETGLGRRCVVQSSIRTRRWGVGRESTSNRRGIRRNGCYAASGEDGYRLVPRLLLQRQICNHQFRAWEIKVRRRKEQRPIPKHGCDFSPPRESATLGRNDYVHRRTI